MYLTFGYIHTADVLRYTWELRWPEFMGNDMSIEWKVCITPFIHQLAVKTHGITQQLLQNVAQ